MGKLSKEQARIKQALVIDDLWPQIIKLGVKQRDILRLLSVPLYSPNKWRAEWDINFDRLRRGRRELRSSVLRARLNIEQIILPLPKGFQAALAPSLELPQLLRDLRHLAECLQPPKDAPLRAILMAPSRGKTGRPSVTSAKDHRIWQLAHLFKKFSGNPRYGLVAKIMNAIFGSDLQDFHVRKSVSRHPNERTCFPNSLKHLNPGKVIQRTRMNLKGAIFYGPPGNILLDPPARASRRPEKKKSA